MSTQGLIARINLSRSPATMNVGALEIAGHDGYVAGPLLPPRQTGPVAPADVAVVLVSLHPFI
jgi:hypothetical protein